MNKFKMKRILTVLLICVLLLQSVALVQAAASDFSDNTEFEYVLTKVDTPDNPGNVKASLMLKTDPEKLITTFGATIVLNLDYFELVDKKGNVETDSYKTDVKILEYNMPLYAAKIGKDALKFSSVKGLTIASYNRANNELYLFVCGMAISGIRIEQKSEVAYLYFNAKRDKVPANAIRVMKQSEVGTACKSQAVMVTQIGCTTEVGDSLSKVSITADENLIDKTKEPETEATTTTTTTEKADVSEESTSPAPTESVTQEQTTKAVEEMSEEEIEKEIDRKIIVEESINIPTELKSTPVIKAYEKAVKKAKDVLEDKNASKQEKAEALKELREAEQTVKETVPELAEQIEKAEKKLEADSSRSPWLFIGIGGGVAVIAAVIIVLIIKNRKKENS